MQGIAKRRGRFGCWVALAMALVPGMAGAEDPPIEDNSFFIEEAYNQEDGVVQHISTFMRFGSPVAGSDYSFTQEWPLGRQAHQVSVTLPYSWSDADSEAGFGDALLNYRYQLFGHDDWAAFAPRVSVVFPTGQRGGHEPGIQINLPASKRLNAWLVAHANAGATFLPAGETRAYNLGASVIGLVTPTFNVMVEVVSNFTSEEDGAGGRISERETIVSPGARYAINAGSLQVVPGLAVPFRRAGGQTFTGVFAYVSFEHPFK